MKQFQEIPHVAQELIDMSKEYLRQETIEPAKRLAKNAGMGIGGAFILSLGALFGVLGVYTLVKMVLPETEWYLVLARLVTGVATAGAAGLVVWRISK